MHVGLCSPGSRFLGISKTNNTAKNRRNSKSLLGMYVLYIGTRISSLMKKKGVKISYDCPFNLNMVTNRGVTGGEGGDANMIVNYTSLLL
jgi:hypothetical protein